MINPPPPPEPGEVQGIVLHPAWCRAFPLLGNESYRAEGEGNRFALPFQGGVRRGMGICFGLLSNMKMLDFLEFVSLALPLSRLGRDRGEG